MTCAQRTLRSPLFSTLATVLALALTTLPGTANAELGEWVVQPIEGGRVVSMLRHPTDPSLVFAGTALTFAHRSQDGGRTWHQIGSGIRGTANAFAIHPAAPSIVWALVINTGTNDQIYRSPDRGDTWELIESDIFPLRLNSIALNPSDPAVIWVSSRLFTDGHLFKTTDGGLNWTRQELEGIWDVAFDPTDSTILFAAGNHAWKSTDSGATWSALADGFFQHVAVDPSTSARAFFYYSLGLLLRVDPDGGLETLQRPIFPAQSLVVGATGKVYVGGLGELWVSRNHGKTWTEMPEPETGTLFNSLLLADGSREPWLLGTDRGVLRSLDRGSSWQPSRKGIQSFITRRISGVPGQPATVLAAADGAGVLRSRDRGETWEVLESVPNRQVQDVVAAPSDPDRLYLGVNAIGDLTTGYRSTDGGETWEPMTPTNFGGLDVALWRVAVDPTDADVILAGSIEFSFPSVDPELDTGFSRSEDGGRTWEPVFEIRNLFDELSQDGGYFQVSQIRFDPGNPKHVYAGLVFLGDSPATTWILRSVDRGRSWKSVFRAPGNLWDFVFHDNQIFSSWTNAEAPIFRSRNGGRTWQPIQVAEFSRAYGFISDPDHDRIFAATGDWLYVSRDGREWDPVEDRGLNRYLIISPYATSLEEDRVTLLGDTQFGVSKFEGCVPTVDNLCLKGRFQVTGAWTDPAGAHPATPGVISREAGFFSFFNPSAVELETKIVDLCAAVGTQAQYSSGMTTLPSSLHTVDLETGAEWTVESAGGAPFPPYVAPDIAACDATDTLTTAPSLAAPSLAADPTLPEYSVPAPPAEPEDDKAAGCGALQLCLEGDRFVAELEFELPDGQTGRGRAVNVSDKSGYFWILDDDNPEVFVKVLAGCAAIPDADYWVFNAGLTDLDVTLTVTDRQTGQTRSYSGGGGQPFPSTFDPSTFSTCP